ncbi:MAG: hypothetical protein M1364_00035 [Candidatus Marsarchaeota archaeon]|jgi:hypothetical protein|nr:hypothetical protein [Candidatus Marsarchaeota archaeon]
MKSLPEGHSDHNILISDNPNIILMPTTSSQKALDEFFSRAGITVNGIKQQDSGHNTAHMLRTHGSSNYRLSEAVYRLRTSSWQSIEPDGFFERASSYGSMGQYCIRVKSIKVIKSNTGNEAALCLMTDFYYNNNSENKPVAFFINGMDIGMAEAKEKSIRQALDDYPNGSVLAAFTAWKRQNYGSKSRDYPFNMTTDYPLSGLCFYVSDSRVMNGNVILVRALY